MSDNIATLTANPQKPEQASLIKTGRSILLKNPVVLIGILVVAFWVITSMLAPFVAPADPLAQEVSTRLSAPGEEGYALGSDELGRDILTRVMYGGRITLPAALAVVIVDGIIGTLIGALAGYAGGLSDEIVMRITELFMAFPTIILAMAITAALGPDIQNAVIALIVVRWPGYARLTRGLILDVKNEDYVEAARSLGAGHFYILRKTLLPNSIAPAIVYGTLDVGNAILVFAGLSFLGLGPEPSSPEWGRMVSIGIDFFDQWWMWLFPGVAIASVVMAFNFIGDGLRDILDPRTRKR